MVLSKGPKDVISDGSTTISCDEQPSLARSGGQGDVLAGVGEGGRDRGLINNGKWSAPDHLEQRISPNPTREDASRVKSLPAWAFLPLSRVDKHT